MWDDHYLFGTCSFIACWSYSCHSFTPPSIPHWSMSEIHSINHAQLCHLSTQVLTFNDGTASNETHHSRRSVWQSWYRLCRTDLHKARLCMQTNHSQRLCLCICIPFRVYLELVCDLTTDAFIACLHCHCLTPVVVTHHSCGFHVSLQWLSPLTPVVVTPHSSRTRARQPCTI